MITWMHLQKNSLLGSANKPYDRLGSIKGVCVKVNWFNTRCILSSSSFFINQRNSLICKAYKILGRVSWVRRSDLKLQKKDSEGIQDKHNSDLAQLSTRYKKKSQTEDGCQNNLQRVIDSVPSKWPTIRHEDRSSKSFLLFLWLWFISIEKQK